MRQIWYQLLFAHWRVPAEKLAALIPPGLELDTFDGNAWLGIVPFGMRGIRLRGLPPVPGTSAFLELNVRTYVRFRDPANARPGVWFFSLDAASRLAVEVARGWFHLPYYYASMNTTQTNSSYHYHSTRQDRRGDGAVLRLEYEPSGDVYKSKPGSLEHWLTERYCLYSTNSRGGLFRGEIHHAPWPLQPARAEIQQNTMAAAAGIPIAGKPETLHFAREIDVAIWPLARI